MAVGDRFDNTVDEGTGVADTAVALYATKTVVGDSPIRTSLGARANGDTTSHMAVAAGIHTGNSLSGVTATGAGAAIDATLARRDWTMQVTGTGTGVTCNFEASLDGATWFAVTPTAVPGTGATVAGSAATTNGLYTILGVPARQMRANLTAIASGNLSAVITGI